jgi:hypothetical protein
LLESVPWLFVATVLRTRSQGLPGLVLFGTQFVQLAVFMAFLLASHRMIELAGGGTNLGRLRFREQLKLGRGILWRLLAASIAIAFAAALLGVNPRTIIFFCLSVDGIVYDWYSGFMPLWSAIIAVVIFLMVVEKGLGREPKYLPVLRQFVERRRHLFPAAVLLAAFLYGANFFQDLLSARLEAVYAAIPLPLTRYFYTGYFLIFSYVRLWITVAILTYALRASYRQRPET